MIHVTVWNENIQDTGIIKDEFLRPGLSNEEIEAYRNQLKANSQVIQNIYPGGIHRAIASSFDSADDIIVTTVTMDMPEYGLSDDLLANTDVLIWWAHKAHNQLPDRIAEKICNCVLKGMGFIALHSAHLSKPFRFLLGTSCTLKWRMNDFCRIWNTCPSHPIAKNIPEMFELPKEEMFGEFFDIPKPDDVVFTSWFRGGEIFRGGCTWTRGYGKIFYFHPGHETNNSLLNPYVKQIIINSVYWAVSEKRREQIMCQHITHPPDRM